MKRLWRWVFYRVSNLLESLGLVAFDLGTPLHCPNTRSFLLNFHQPRQNFADSVTLKYQVNPNQFTSWWVTFKVRLSMSNARMGNGQVRPVLFVGQVEDFDPYLVRSRNLSRVGQVRPVDPCGQVRDLDLSSVNSRNLSRVGPVKPVNSRGQVRNIDPSLSK